MNRSILSSLFWKFVNGGSAQIMQVIVSMIVARLLIPSDFGIVALLLVFTSIATVIVQSGLGMALIQQKEIKSIDLSSIFVYSLVLASILYVVLFFLAPFVASFYEMPQMIILLRIMSLVLFIGAFTTVQNALVARRMLWKEQCLCNIISVFLSGTIGVALALRNMGPWAIVFQQLSYQLFLSITVSFIVKWIPSLRFSLTRTIPLFNYGFKLLGANLINTFYHNIETLIIGKQFNAAILAFFNRGKIFPLVITDNVDGTLQSVMFPVLSRKQSCLLDLKDTLRKSISASTFLLYPTLSILFFCSNSLISLLLGTNWAQAVPFVKWYCIIGMFFPLQTTSGQAINAIGKSEIFFKITTIKRFVSVLLLFVLLFLFKSVSVIVITAIVMEILATSIHFYYNSKLLRYNYIDQFKDIKDNVFVTMVLFGVYFVFDPLVSNSLILDIIYKGFIYAGLYLFIMYIINSKNLSYLIMRFNLMRFN